MDHAEKQPDFHQNVGADFIHICEHLVSKSMEISVLILHKNRYIVVIQVNLNKPVSILSKVKDGDTVKVHYTGTLTEDGTVFDSSREREPLEFTLGEGKLIPGFEQAVIGMEVGDDTTVEIESDDAYGQRREDLELEVAKSDLPDNIDPQVGMQLQMQQQENGQAIPVQITAVEDDYVKLDANHPLAGKDLTFDIELVEVVD